MPPAVETLGLTRRFGAVTAVSELSLSVAAGSIFGLLGPNGAGKTTTIKRLTTMLPPTAGSAKVSRFDTLRQPVEVRRSIGYVSQMLSADGALTAFFTSNAIYPLSIMPTWLRALAKANPLSYQVDALRLLMVQGGQPIFGLGADLTVLLLVFLVLILVTARLYPNVVR